MLTKLNWHSMVLVKEEPNFTEVALIADEIAKLGNYENVEILQQICF